MFKFHNKLLPTVFDTYFHPISTIHNYRTRLSSKDAFSLPRVRTNYGIFNICFSGVKVWNALKPDIKLLSMSIFKARLKSNLISKYYISLTDLHRLLLPTDIYSYIYIYIYIYIISLSSVLVLFCFSSNYHYFSSACSSFFLLFFFLVPN